LPLTGPVIPAGDKPPTGLRPVRLWQAMSTVLFLLFLGSRYQERSKAGSQTQVSDSNNRSLLWSELFNKDHDTEVVCADSALVLLQDIANRSITLREYLSPDYSTKLSHPN